VSGPVPDVPAQGAVVARFRVLIVAGVTVAIGVGLQSLAAEAWIRDYPRQSYFKYCFVSTPSNQVLNANRKARFRDALATWKQRAVMTWAEVSCSDSNALTVRMADLGTMSGTLAQTIRNGFHNPVRVEFDWNETWNDGRDEPTSSEVDFWGVAAHEIGHVWGLDHGCTNCLTPLDSEYSTMNAENRGYSVIPFGSESRDLTSDDEAGARWVDDLRIVPNRGFERLTDTISAVRTVPAYYWRGNNTFLLSCNDGLAYEGVCHVSNSTAGGYIYVQFRHKFVAPGNVNLVSFYARNAWSATGRIRLSVIDVTTQQTLANQTFSIPGGNSGPWTLYSLNFTSLTSALHVLQFAVYNELPGALVRFDLLTFRE